MVFFQESDIRSGNVTSVATYTPRTELDFGTLVRFPIYTKLVLKLHTKFISKVCYGLNSIGMGSPCIYHLLPTGPPEPPSHCDTRNVTYSTVKVGISATCRFTKKSKFTIQLLKMGESISVVMSRLYFPTRHKICYLSLSLPNPTPPPPKKKEKKW